MTQHVGDVMGSQAWADGRTKTNITPKNVHTLFFLVVGEVATSCFGGIAIPCS